MAWRKRRGRPAATAAKPVSLAQPTRKVELPPQRPEIGAAALIKVRDAKTFTEYRRVVDGATVLVHRKGTRVLTHPLDQYLHRGRIDGVLHGHGMALAAMHEAALGSSGYSTADLNGMRGVTGGGFRLSDSMSRSLTELLRKERWFDPAEWRMLVGVCWHGHWAVEMATPCCIPKRGAFRFLRLSLLKLAELDQTGRIAKAPSLPAGGVVLV